MCISHSENTWGIDELDPFVRGFNELLMDAHLDEIEIKNVKGITRVFDKQIKSRIDAQIGFLIGYTYAKLVMQFLILRNRLPDKGETEEFFNLMKKRYPEILSALKRGKVAEIMDRDDKVISIDDLDVDLDVEPED
jgi:hypothetical protein